MSKHSIARLFSAALALGAPFAHAQLGSQPAKLDVIKVRDDIYVISNVAVMPALVRMQDLGLASWQDLPRVAAWFDNIRAEPAFAPTYYHGSLLSERFPHLRERKST